jgi:hypothetical protein
MIRNWLWIWLPWERMNHPPKEINRYWTSPLEWCVEQDKPLMMKTLLDLGAIMTCSHLDPERARTNLLVACYQKSRIQCGILLLDRGYKRMPSYWVHPSCRTMVTPKWSLEFEWFRWTTKRGCFALAAALKKCGLMCRNVRRIMMEMLWSKQFE